MKGRIVEPHAAVYSQPDAMSPVLAELPAGTEVEIDGVKKVAEESWIQVRGANGKPGFLPAKTRIFVIKQASLNQPSANAYMRPGADSPPIRQYNQGALLTLLDTTTQDGATWIKIRDAMGNEGYIDGKTQLATGDAVAASSSPGDVSVSPRAIRIGAASGKDAGRRNMLYGALWCIGGIVLTCVTASMASRGGGTYLIFWGAIIFGAIQFIRGLVQYIRSPA